MIFLLYQASSNAGRDFICEYLYIGRTLYMILKFISAAYDL